MSTQDSPIILWFRQDLRLKDNPALTAAHETGRPIIPLYILDDENAGDWKIGAASRWWLHHSLTKLNENLDHKMVFATGDAKDILLDLIKETNAEGVYWNRCYEPWRITRDKDIKSTLKSQNIDAQSFNGTLLFEPHTVLKKDGTPYRVFTPFYKKGCLERGPKPRTPLSTAQNLRFFDTRLKSLDDLNLIPKINWYSEMEQTWTPGEADAQEALKTFFDHGLKDYQDGRNFPAKPNVSRLSPHLHYGEISPNDIWYTSEQHMIAEQCEGMELPFLRQLVWREFSNSLLFHVPDMPRAPLQSKFDNFPWRSPDETLTAWQHGKTGYPIIDAGMRELWQTGYMHNRVRMIVGSFLVKNLLLHWHHGEDWFWDTLVDANLANNSASWQWIAGCGADAAPYFRIFNPITQGKKFDSDGDYVRRFVPELTKIPNKFIHAPWEAPSNVLEYAGVTLGSTYPKPIVDLKASRERALAALKTISQK